MPENEVSREEIVNIVKTTMLDVLAAQKTGPVAALPVDSPVTEITVRVGAAHHIQTLSSGNSANFREISTSPQCVPPECETGISPKFSEAGEGLLLRAMEARGETRSHLLNRLQNEVLGELLQSKIEEKLAAEFGGSGGTP